MRRREGVTTQPPPEIQAIEDPATRRLIRDLYDHQFTEAEGATTTEQVSQTASAFVDRGDPSAVDFDEGDLTVDGSWHDLDLASIVPAGCSAVLLRVTLDHSGGGDNTIKFREDGNSNEYNVATVTRCGDASVTATADVLVKVASQTIEYNVSSGQTDIVVGGWWV